MKLPDFLNDIEIETTRAPATEVEKDLPFDLLEPRVFERFCCELVYKKAELELGADVIDVIPIGTSGQKQYGADIFVKENEALIQIIPAVKGGPGDTQLVQCLLGGQMRAFDQPDDLELF